MQRSVPPLLTSAMAVSGLIALWGLDQGPFWLGAVFKPATTVCLFLVLGRADIALRRRLRGGLVFSLLGDLALLGAGPLWFQVGLGAFLVAHLFYIAAFAPFAKWTRRLGVTAALGLGGAVTTNVLAYPRASELGVFAAVLVYSAVLTAMLVTVNGTVGSVLREAPRAALGALLFYLADMSIAVKVFIPQLPLPHPVLFTTGLYWVGQYYIASAARAGLRDGERERSRRTPQTAISE